uniref:RXLR effector n=1 Tax=Hyaloperonospora arabidopsidis TaxID=272952 RepID=F6MF02_HYAAB|nr:RXLR effector [Hyaloperonospora arabidopsidis]
MQLLRQLVLVAVVTSSASAVDIPAIATPVEASQQRTHLRGLLAKLVTYESAVPPVRELAATWGEGGVGDSRPLRPLEENIVGGQTVVVFHDRRLSPEAKMESAVVAFDVRSSPNCVVSVCGELSKWYLGSKEQCFDLRIAPKSTDKLENGLIRGVSAAYSSRRPVASNLYLKFDATNFIDGSKCEYEILSGSKTVREEEVASGLQTAVA